MRDFKEVIAELVLAFVTIVIGGGNVVMWMLSMSKFLGGFWVFVGYILINILLLLICTVILEYCTRED